MQKTGNLQINTRTYWNHLYSDESKRDGLWDKTSRFDTTLNYIKDGQKFLDIGCGVGTMCRMVKDKYPNCEVWGTDIADQTIEENKKIHPGINFIAQHVGFQDQIPSDYFDVVFSGEVLEHLDFPEDLFKDASRMVKTGGIFICTTPIKHYVTSSEHLWYFTHEDVSKFFRDYGFEAPEMVELANMEALYVIYAVGRKL